MFDLRLAILAALVMLILEYTVLLRLYRRSEYLEKVSLFVAPAMIVGGMFIAHILQTYTPFFVKNRMDNVALFISFALIELPLALRGYDLTPDASVFERVIIATTFGSASIHIAQSLMSL
jgi:hypothetical protein